MGDDEGPAQRAWPFVQKEVRMLGNKDIVAFLPTRDFDKSRAFYEGVLGLRFVHNDGFAMVLDANGTMVRMWMFSYGSGRT